MSNGKYFFCSRQYCNDRESPWLLSYMKVIKIILCIFFIFPNKNIWQNLKARSLMVSNLRSETEGYQFESGC